MASKGEGNSNDNDQCGGPSLRSGLRRKTINNRDNGKDRDNSKDSDNRNGKSNGKEKKQIPRGNDRKKGKSESGSFAWPR